jgi:hypothetical protein
MSGRAEIPLGRTSTYREAANRNCSSPRRNRYLMGTRAFSASNHGRTTVAQRLLINFRELMSAGWNALL